MTKEPSAPAAINVDETHKVHRKAAMYAIPKGLEIAQAGIFVLGVIVFGLFGVNGHAQSLRFGGR